MRISDLQNGELFTAGPSATVATERHQDVAVVRIHGNLTAASGISLASSLAKLRRDGSVRVVVLSINSLLSEVAFVWQPFEEMEYLTESKVTFAYIRNALGGVQLVALAARGVYSHPMARIGYLGASVIGDSSPAAMALSKQCNRGLVDRLLKLRPEVNAARLLHTTVNGEAAEALGVVDFVISSEVDWLGKILKRSEKREQI